ncbi:hypothetical protein CDL15_Pgr019479 [Punica granatum]|uniref:Uncharacterized protein n=1 Tax=Punica granatum TaxID=22663 RepID=A0A218VTC0_PUNGR|nr:hypothetical protein CDL15_Pgr019479 [Punica granatum]
MFEQCIGEFGWAQLAQAMLASLAWFFDAQQTFISMFTDSDLSSSFAATSSSYHAFSSIIWPYATLCFVCGFGLAAIGTCALMLSMELVRRRWQGMVGMMGFLVFTLGFLSLPMGTAIPALLYCGLVYFFVHESLRWLLVKGQKEEAIRILKSIAPPEQHSRLTSGFSYVSASLDNASSPSTTAVSLFSAMKLLLTRRWALLRISSVGLSKI